MANFHIPSRWIDGLRDGSITQYRTPVEMWVIGRVNDLLNENAVLKNGLVYLCPFGKVGQVVSLVDGAGRSIQARVTNTRTERLRDITHDDMAAMGWDFGNHPFKRLLFKTKWDKAHKGKYCWRENPLVWVVGLVPIFPVAGDR